MLFTIVCMIFDLNFFYKKPALDVIVGKAPATLELVFGAALIIILEVEDLEVKFALRGGDLTAINGASFTLDPGEKMGIVGESGAGKSVTGFAIINLISKPGFISGGRILFNGEEISTFSDEKMRKIRGNRISMVFQDPMMTLNPVFTIGTQMVETLKAHRNISRHEAEKIALEKLRKVYIPSPEKRLAQYPHEFSGGQRQRISIARALILDPDFIVADEPVSALDVSIQAQILNLLMEAGRERGLTYLFITHDLSVVQHISSRVAVMYLGTLCEVAKADALFTTARHPYTRALSSAIPRVGEKKAKHIKLKGEVPTPVNLPTGCVFHGRCIYARERCVKEVPKFLSLGTGTFVACHGVGENWAMA